MSSAHSTHNKKRNAGLLYEFLVRSMSDAIVAKNDKRSGVALKILKKYFKPGTELYKEFRLVKSLVDTTVSSEHVAASIIVEAKRAARERNARELDRELSMLIKEVNHTLGDESFFDRHVQEYRRYASTQQLLNCWRETSKVDISQLARCEDQVMKNLTERRDVNETVCDAEFVDGGPGMNRLVLKLMMKKLNEKYTGKLLPEQRDVLKVYAFSTMKNDGDFLKQKLVGVKATVLGSLDSFVSRCGNDASLTSKINETKCVIERETLDVIDDAVIARFMSYLKFSHELDGEQ